MYGYWAYQLNYEAYQKQETEIDKQLNDFFTKENMYEGVPQDMIESAFIIRLDTEYFEVDDEPVGEYYLIIIGYNGFDFAELEHILYVLYDDYKKHLDLILRYETMSSKGSSKNFPLKDLETLYLLTQKYPILNCFDNNFTPEEEFDKILCKQKSPYGEIIKTFVS